MASSIAALGLQYSVAAIALEEAMAQKIATAQRTIGLLLRIAIPKSILRCLHILDAIDQSDNGGIDCAIEKRIRGLGGVCSGSHTKTKPPVSFCNNGDAQFGNPGRPGRVRSTLMDQARQ